MNNTKAVPTWAPLGTAFRFVQLTLGFLLLLASSFWTGLGSGGLERISLVRPDLIFPGKELSEWLFMVILTAVGVSLWFGSKPSGLATARLDAAQLVGAIIFAFMILIFLPILSEFEFLDVDNQCLYEGCWPRPYQKLLIAVPSLAAILAMGICSVIGNRVPYWTRRAIAPVTYLILALLQHATWNSIIVPFLGGPPPLGH
ncbi:hypothetical protein [Paenarthrobacter ilicis]|uniref:hypothetical protein n=1 Tax=Paenarthrobacter ilicis TaxID=43665 RepID=UPI0028D6817A|nr:hypothetical protein [Paenarthrobacter ilicis]